MKTLKQFWLKCIIFILPLVPLFIYMEYKLRRIKVNDLSEKKIILDKKNLDSIQVLVLGSSHALNAVDPKFLSLPTFNFAHSGQSVYYDTRLCIKYLEKMQNLKMVILPISYFSLHKIANNDRKIDYYHTYNISHDSLEYDFSVFSYIYKYSPRGSIDRIWFAKENDFSMDSLGFEKRDSIGSYKKITELSGFKRFGEHNKWMWENAYEQSCLEVENLIKVLKNKKINLCFITTPHYTFISQHFKTRILQKNKKFVDEMCQKYSCTYLNYQDDNRFEIQDFADCDHLNYIGAEKFSTVLNKDLMKIFKKEE